MRRELGLMGPKTKQNLKNTRLRRWVHVSELLFQESIPFAVIGGNTVIEVRGQRVRGRLYPWGVVEGKTLDRTLRGSVSGTGTAVMWISCCFQWKTRLTATSSS